MREMKDSGHETIGLVPSDWTGKRLKYLCKIQTGNEDTQNANPEGKYPFYVRSPIVEHCDRYTFDGEGILVAGDGAGAGRIFHHVYGKYAVHQRVYRLSHFAGNADFIYYYLSNLFPHEMDKGSAQSTVPSMRLPMLLNFPLFLPSKKEQDKIVTFLDSKCSEIDAISADIQKEIETLEQYKRSVITEAVTKGLNPDVEMKDSGAEWIGKIPLNWKLEKGKHLFRQRNSKGNNISLQLLSPSQKYGVIPQTLLEKLTTQNVVKTNERADLENFKTIHKGDFCISLRSFQGGLEYSEYEGVVSPAYQVFYKVEPLYNNYYRYLFKENSFIKKMNSFTMTLRDGKNIAFSDFGGTYIPVPPLDEQEKIATFLNKKSSEIDSLVAEKKQQLEVLDSYKKSLIYEYVTGKKEVV